MESERGQSATSGLASLHSQRTRLWLPLILIAYVILAITYALATPPLEASDEYKHYPVVQHVQSSATLPVLDPASPGRWLQEAAQPPLYYLLMAAFTLWIDSSDLEEVHQVNPHAFVGNPNQIANKNLIIHSPEGEAFPWRGTVLAVYVIRLISIVLGLGTIILTSRLGNLLFGPVVGLLAAALTAFNPMFLFVSAAVNNDSLAILLGALGIYLLVLLWRETPDPRRHWTRYVFLGLVLGLGLSTKLSLGGLLMLAVLALAWITWRQHNWRYLVWGGALVIIPLLIVTSPWLVRNLRLYGDPTALAVFIDVQDARTTAITLADWVGEFGTLYRSFWGLFGGVNIAAPQLLYIAYNLLALAGTAGFVYWLWLHRHDEPVESEPKSREDRGRNEPRQPERSAVRRFLQESPAVTGGLWLLILWPLLMFLSLARWNMFAPSFQGRLLFPALGTLNILWAAGLLALIKTGKRQLCALGLSTAALAVAAVLPWATIRPAYAFPESLLTVPDDALFGPITFREGQDELQLVGLEMEPGQSVTSGADPVEVILYWQAIGPIDQDYLSTVHLLGRNLVSVGQVDRYPASGMVPTSHWQPGQIWRDVYHIYPGRDALAPTRLLVKAGLHNTKLKRDVASFGPDGVPIELLVVGEAKLTPVGPEERTPNNRLSVQLVDGIILEGYDLEPQAPRSGDMLQLTLHWEVFDGPSNDYTVFVHLMDGLGNQIAVADGPPVEGNYPTNLWRAGEQIMDEHSLALPADLLPGRYWISVGLYDPVSSERVARSDGAGDAIQWPVEVGSER